MSKRRASEIWQEIKPYAMRDIKTMQSMSKTVASSVGYQITLHAEKTRYYEASATGLAAAIAAAVNGNMISLPPSSIDGDHSVPAGVSLFGIDRNRSTLTGQITLAGNAHLGKVSVIRSGSSATPIKGVILTGSNARLNDCVVDVTNVSGDAIGVYCNTGVSAYVDDCFVSATGSANGYGCYVNNGTLYIQSGKITGSTGATGGASVVYRMIGIDNVFKGTASIAWHYDEFDETIEADVLPAGVDHDLLLHYVPDEHVDHGTVEIIAGNGLTGGGNLLANRTLDIGAGDGIEVGVDAISVDESFAFIWTGGHTFQADILARNITGRHLQPEATDTYDLGSSVKLWRKGYLSELEALLFTKNSINLLGGWLYISKNEGSFEADVAAADNTIDFGQAMTNGDFVLCRAAGKVEYIEVGTVSSGTVYNVTRDKDGSGANDWPAGTPYAVLGNTGDGRIELNAYDSPRIQIIEQGATYNAQVERLRLGDLNGNWGYSSAVYGLAIGEYGSNKPNLTVDATHGLRIRNYSTDVLVFDTDGNAKIMNKLLMSGANAAISIGETPPTAANAGTGIWLDRTGYYGLDNDIYQVKIDAVDGKFYAGGGAIVIDDSGINVVEDSSVINFFDDGSFVGSMAIVESGTEKSIKIARVVPDSYGSELVPNGTFDVNTDGWTLTNGVSRDTTDPYSGAGCLKFSGIVNANAKSTNFVSVNKSTAYRISFYKKTDPSSVGTMFVWEYDSSFNISSVHKISTSHTVSGWNYVFRDLETAHNTAYIKIQIYTLREHDFYLDSISLKEIISGPVFAVNEDNVSIKSNVLIDGGLNVGGTADPGDDNLVVGGSFTLGGNKVGVWTSYTPTISYSGGTIDPKSETINSARYCIIGDAVLLQLNISITRETGNRTTTIFQTPTNTAVANQIGTAYSTIRGSEIVHKARIASNEVQIFHGEMTSDGIIRCAIFYERG